MSLGIASASASSRQDTQHVRQFLTYLVPCISGFALVYGIVAAVYRDIPTALASGIIASYIGVLLIARRWVERGALERAITSAARGLLVAVLLLTACQPALFANFALIPILVVAIVLPYRTRTTIRPVLVICWITSVLIVVMGVAISVPTQLPARLVDGLRASTLSATTSFILLLLWQFHSRLTATLEHTRSAHQELAVAHSALAEQTAEIQAALRAAQEHAAAQARLLEENMQQRQLIQTLSVPVLPVGVSTLVVPLVGALDTGRLAAFSDQVLQSIEQRHARLVVVDITGVPIVDTQVAQGLIQVVQSTRLMGAEMLLVGIRPEVAQAIIGLGINLPIRTAPHLAAALQQRHVA